jgi:hypothetical protein
MGMAGTLSTFRTWGTGTAMNKLKQVWSSLPHQIQAATVAFSSGFMAAAAHVLSEPGACLSPSCLRHYVGTFITAGIVAVRGFYMLPSNVVNYAPSNSPSLARRAKSS